MTDPTMEILMMARIKSLSVTVLHPSVHIVCLHEMKHPTTEAVQALVLVREEMQLTGICPKGVLVTSVMFSYLEESC